MLVEAVLVAPGLVAVCRPEARRIRRQHLVDQNVFRLAVRARHPSPLELGVGDDDPAAAGIVSRPAVNVHAAVAKQ